MPALESRLLICSTLSQRRGLGIVNRKIRQMIRQELFPHPGIGNVSILKGGRFDSFGNLGLEYD